MVKLIKYLLVLLLIAGPAWGATYNIGPGQTYETFAAFHAAVTVQGNDIVDGGTNTFDEEITVADSGTSGNPITYQNIVVHGWQTMTGFSDGNEDGEYTVALTTDPGMVEIDGSIAEHGTAGSLTSGQWDWSANVLYVYGDPSGSVVKASVRDQPFMVTGDWVNVVNVTSEGADYVSQNSGAILLSGCANVNVYNCTANKSVIGVSMYQTDGPISIYNNTIRYNGVGVKAYQSTTGDKYIYGNSILDTNWDGDSRLNADWDGEAIGNTGSDELYIHSNTVERAWVGIKNYGFAGETHDNWNVYANTINNIGGNGLAVGAEDATVNITAHYWGNVVANVGYHDDTASSWAFNGPSVSISTGTLNLYNNTSYNCNNSWYVRGVTLNHANNISYSPQMTNGYHCYFRDVTLSLNDYNSYYSGESARWLVYGQTQQFNLAGWQGITGVDEENSLTSDPQLGTDNCFSPATTAVLYGGAPITALCGENDVQDNPIDCQNMPMGAVAGDTPFHATFSSATLTSATIGQAANTYAALYTPAESEDELCAECLTFDGTNALTFDGTNMLTF